MKNNTGFTLVELLATIVIIALIGGIGALAYTSIIRQSEDKNYEAYEKTMHAETMNLIMKKLNLMPKNGETKKFTLAYMIDNNYIDPIKNPRNKDDLCNTSSSFIEVTRENVGSVDSFTYRVCLVCNDYNSDGSKCKTFEN